MSTNKAPFCFRRAAPSILLGMLCSAGLLAQSTTVFPAVGPGDITVGPDGAVWYTDYAAQSIGRIDGNGSVTTFPTGGNPASIATGSDGNLWYTDPDAGGVGRMTTSGIVTWMGRPSGPDADPNAITPGPDGNLWFLDYDHIVRMTTSGVITEFRVLDAIVQPALGSIVAGPDGNLWFTEPLANRIGRITTSGTATEFALPRADIFPLQIVAGGDGNLWFTERYHSPTYNEKVGRITPTGEVTEFAAPGGASAIVAGTDGNLWLSQYGAPLKRMTTSGALTMFPTPDVSWVDPVGMATSADGAIWIAGGADGFDGIAGQIVRVSSDTSACVANANTLCLDNGRFRVTANWTAGDGSTGQGRGVTLTANSGYFWFFDAANVELVVKVLDGCSANHNHWVFAAGLTNVGVTTTVTDTYTGSTRVYTNPAGTPFAPVQDTAAFATCQ